ncbi:hypothetical protein KFE25_006962 [Diacronema lutheri]|uniref:Glycerophosphodiester phosphodiesterase n=2 Tax=Diacronema lutheri TaxID=2081491 RepID=A0A8J5XU06_DIALT|nr:hypothetical protein KFE25_006962 [Diacronema lutheri]
MAVARPIAAVTLVLVLVMRVRWAAPAAVSAHLPAVYAHRGACGGCGFPPGSLGALDALASTGACGFDVDIFRTADRHLVVGHPDELQARLKLARSPELLGLQRLRQLDGGSTATVQRYLERAHARCARAGSDRRVPVLLLEPKGAAARHVLETIVQVRRIAERASTPRFVGLWLEATAAAAAAGPWLVTLYALKVKHVAPVGRPLGAADVRVQRAWNGVGPFWRMLTPVFAREARRAGQLLFTWVVDSDEAARVALGAGADVVISDDAVGMRARLLALSGSR